MYKIKLIPYIMVIFSLMVGSSFADTKLPKGYPSPVMPLGVNAKLPKHYPSYMMPSGKITKVLKQSRAIIVDGAAYKLHPVHDIYTKRKGIQATLYNLKPGMKVAFEFTTYQGKRVVHKVWILPKNYPTTQYAH